METPWSDWAKAAPVIALRETRTAREIFFVVTSIDSLNPGWPVTLSVTLNARQQVLLQRGCYISLRFVCLAAAIMLFVSTARLPGQSVDRAGDNTGEAQCFLVLNFEICNDRFDGRLMHSCLNKDQQVDTRKSAQDRPFHGAQFLSRQTPAAAGKARHAGVSRC
jgi:hypothetical protein